MCVSVAFHRLLGNLNRCWGTLDDVIRHAAPEIPYIPQADRYGTSRSQVREWCISFNFRSSAQLSHIQHLFAHRKLPIHCELTNFQLCEEELLCLCVLTNLRVTSLHQMVVEELIFSDKLTHEHSPIETDLGF